MEILELAKIFINKNVLGKFEINSLFEEFDLLRKKTLDKLMVNKTFINNSTNDRLYDCKQNYFSRVHIPNSYLEQNLVFSEALKEKSKKITKRIKSLTIYPKPKLILSGVYSQLYYTFLSSPKNLDYHISSQDYFFHTCECN